MAHLIGTTSNGHQVYVDLIASEVAKRIARQPGLLTLATEILPAMILGEGQTKLEFDMRRTVGYDFVVKTTDADTIFYVQLARDDLYTRFTKNGKPLATRYVSLNLEPSLSEGGYLLQDIRIGRTVPPRPGSGHDTTGSKIYWRDHAVIFQDQAIQSRTLTKDCPY